MRTEPTTTAGPRTLIALAAACAALACAPVHAQPAGAANAPAPQVLLPDFTSLVERVGPAVVNIRTLERSHPVHADAGSDDSGLGDLLRRFGVPVPQTPSHHADPHHAPGADDGDSGDDGDDSADDDLPEGVGSGFILSADGFVMTNAHVIEDADEVIVTLTDKREFKARVVGADKRSDIAVLKIEATGLPTVRLGDVDKLKVGEWVLAIGSPFDLDNTVTAGIVSAKQRDTGDYLPFIQTDVAVNPGNSGGPLINMRGEVVGINSQIYSRSGGFMGISFAIPIDEARKVADQLRANGHVVRGRIGVQITSVTNDVAQSLGLSAASAGALVRSVEPDGPAALGGVLPGDIVTQVDGHPVERANDLQRLVGAAHPGGRVVLHVWRGGTFRDVALTVAELDAEPAHHALPSARKNDTPAPLRQLGLSVSELDPAARRELKIDGGVAVDAAEGAAQRAGIRAGDVVLAVDDHPVTSVHQFQSAVEKADRNRPLSLLVRRGDGVDYVVVRPAR